MREKRKKSGETAKKAGACSQASELRAQQNYYNLLLVQPPFGGASRMSSFSKIQLVVYYQCCVLIG